jgi:sugar phosphate isomerase/epimerase
MKLGSRHLTYCSNIHAGESWSSVRETLGDVLPALRGHLRWSGPLGVGLRLSAAAAETLEDAPVMEEFRRFLALGDYYVFTINGFPFGAFHGTRVKERVYDPDWRHDSRLTYTNRLAGLLATLAAGHGVAAPSVSTVPGAFRAGVRTDADRAAVARGFLRHAAHLVELRQRTGQCITVAIEPEPACQFETTAEVVDFLEGWVLQPDALREVVTETGTVVTLADLRRHLGICLDTCHLAVAGEDPVVALARIRAAGLRVHKVQVSSALAVDTPSAADTQAALSRFADDTYLHQVVEQAPGGVVRFDDLPEALASARRGECGHTPWRVHFHVPIFLESLGAFRTTQPELRATLDAVIQEDACAQFEVETYTWDVLPEEFRSTSMVEAIARELAWARSAIERAPSW